jgi:hypothetical protein
MGRVLRVKEDGRLARFALLYVEGTFEDPDMGAYGDFVEEITDVADSVVMFSPRSSAARVCEYLCDLYPQPPLRLHVSK